LFPGNFGCEEDQKGDGEIEKVQDTREDKSDYPWSVGSARYYEERKKLVTRRER
jgi:hypothetical protein